MQDTYYRLCQVGWWRQQPESELTHLLFLRASQLLVTMLPAPPARRRAVLTEASEGVLAAHFGAVRFALCPLPGQVALPLLQHEGQGDGAHQVLPRLLLRVSQDALRHPPEEMPQVQLCLWRQRLPPHLHHLKRRRRRKRRVRVGRGAGTKGASRLELRPWK